MSIIYRTTLTPAKLELLTGWLPSQPWYRPTGSAPDLVKAGGFRLDDPEGEVGIEFLVAADAQEGVVSPYLVPMTYRGRPRDGDGTGLIGTAEHGVLGKRWIYDGTTDPVLVSELVALIQGTAEPQAQSQNDTPDPTVLSRPALSGPAFVTGFEPVPSEEGGTDLRVRVGDRVLAVRFHRILTPVVGESVPAGCVSAAWKQPDGTHAQGVFVTARAV